MSDRDTAEACRCIAGASPNRAAVLFLLGLPEAEARASLLPAADACRRARLGDAVHLRGIIEFSNACSQDCLYCGLRCSNSQLPRYRMADAEILAVARRIAAEGIGTVVLQSGEDKVFTVRRLCGIVSRIKRETGLAITLSVGERPKGDYRAFREAGADRYLLKFETSDPDLYRRLRPGRELAERLQALADLRELCYEVGTGNMVGLPGQSLESLADDLLLLRSLGADMLGIGPFLPHPQTPLAGAPPGDLFSCLKALAIARLLTGGTHIPATTALATREPQGRRLALQAGADVVMPDFTPPAFRRRYEIYPGREREQDLALFLETLYGDITVLGRRLGKGPGGRARTSAGP